MYPNQTKHFMAALAQLVSVLVSAYRLLVFCCARCQFSMYMSLAAERLAREAGMTSIEYQLSMSIEQIDELIYLEGPERKEAKMRREELRQQMVDAKQRNRELRALGQPEEPIEKFAKYVKTEQELQAEKEQQERFEQFKKIEHERISKQMAKDMAQARENINKEIENNKKKQTVLSDEELEAYLNNRMNLFNSGH